MKLCDAFIDVPGDNWASCYCKLPAGHDGPHSAHYPAERAMREAITRPDAPS